MRNIWYYTKLYWLLGKCQVPCPGNSNYMCGDELFHSFYVTGNKLNVKNKITTFIFSKNVNKFLKVLIIYFL